MLLRSNDFLSSYGLSKVYVKQKINAIKNIDNNTQINKGEIRRRTEINYFASAGGSFSALFKPASNIIPMDGIPSNEDEFISYFMEFINSSIDIERLSVFVAKLDVKIINRYKDLLNVIIGAKLNFFLKWENAITNTHIKENIGYQKAQDILDVIEKLEFEENDNEVKITGRFSALNVKSGKYEFYELEEPENISKGKMDRERHQMCFQIDFKHTYDVIIKRRIAKEAGSKNPRTFDELISFVQI